MTPTPSVLRAISVLRVEARVQDDEAWAVYLAADLVTKLRQELEVPDNATDLKVLGMPIRMIDAAVPGTIYLSMETFQ